jgi:hypothetical protein
LNVFVDRTEIPRNTYHTMQTKTLKEYRLPILTAMSQGATDTQISRDYAMSGTAVHGIRVGRLWKKERAEFEAAGGKIPLHSPGLTGGRHGGGHTKAITEAFVLLASGLTIPEAAEKVGVTYNILYTAVSGRTYPDVNRHGVTTQSLAKRRTEEVVALWALRMKARSDAKIAAEEAEEAYREHRAAATKARLAEENRREEAARIAEREARRPKQTPEQRAAEQAAIDRLNAEAMAYILGIERQEAEEAAKQAQAKLDNSKPAPKADL